MKRFYHLVKECSGGGGTTEITYEGGLLSTNLLTSFSLPSGVTKIEYLVVGGGGSGGNASINNIATGGGGGGELIEGEILNPQGGKYDIVVGSRSSNSNGNASSITLPNSSTIVAEGGKIGARNAAAGDATATEGAGGGSSVDGFTAGGTGTNAGGDGVSTVAAAGGGGAGGAGSTSTSTGVDPDGGGAGKTSILFGDTYGEGGGSWAVHGTNKAGVNGAPNTGNGGSGRNYITAGVRTPGDGGSGIIKIRIYWD